MNKSETDTFEYDIIRKPKTKFTANVLRRAIPNINIQDKIGTISMNKLNIFSTFRLAGGNSQPEITKKVRSVATLPKMLSFDSGAMNKIAITRKESTIKDKQ
jgi:hypothetical protein